MPAEELMPYGSGNISRRDVPLIPVQRSSVQDTTIEQRMKELDLNEEDLQNEPDYNNFKDPIHFGLILDPVVDALGYTADRKSYEGWFSQHKNTTLTTGLVLPNTNLIPNIEMRCRILSFIENIANKKKSLCRARSIL